jgi:hypothetical protein
LHPEYFSKRFLPSLPSRNIQFQFDPRVLGHPVYYFLVTAEEQLVIKKSQITYYKIEHCSQICHISFFFCPKRHTGILHKDKPRDSHSKIKINRYKIREGTTRCVSELQRFPVSLF